MSKLTIQDLVYEAHRNAREKGFWEKYEDPYSQELFLNPGERLSKHMLMVMELAEASECVRNRECDYYMMADNLGLFFKSLPPVMKPEGELAELADVVIRIADYCGALGFDLEKAIQEKMQYNKTRETKHGKVL